MASGNSHGGVRRRISKKSPDVAAGGRKRDATIADFTTPLEQIAKVELDECLAKTNSIELVVDGVRYRVPFEQRVVYRRPNPKNEGTAACKRYGAYMGAKTIGAACSKGSRRADFLFDFKKGYVELPNLMALAVPVEQISIAPQRRAVQAQLAPARERAQAARVRGQLRSEQQKDELTQCLARRLLHIDLTEGPARKTRSAAETPLPHLSEEPPVPYYVVVLSYPHAKRVKCLRTHTLAFLQRQQVPWSQIYLVVATEAERKLYAASLGTVSLQILVVGAPGVVRARNWVVTHFEEGAHILSLDDDIEDVLVGGAATGSPLPAGGLDGLVRHADRLMRAQKAFIWGLNVSKSYLNSRTTISRTSGLVNGHLYGYLNRPNLRELMPCLGEAAEDCERSLRYFVHDQVLLRYCMYCASTRVFLTSGGMQSLFVDQAARKQAENTHIERLQEACPALIRLDPKLRMETVNASFTRVGLPPLRPDGFGGWASGKGEKTK